MMSYYLRFKIVIGNPVFRAYLSWAYNLGISDLKQLNFVPSFGNDFTALLCGVGNEGTADTFITYVKKLNPKAKIVIIDIGVEQIAAVKSLVNKKYKNLNVTVFQADALNLDKLIPKHSVNWIETDWIFAYFDHDRLRQLLAVWHHILADDGFITIRCGVDRHWFDWLVTKIVIWIGRIWLGVTLYSHDKQGVDRLIVASGFTATSHPMILPTAYRYAIIKTR